MPSIAQQKRFSDKACKELKSYVYVYLDPGRKSQTAFYVGKGRGNRCFSHLKDSRASTKVKRITEIIDTRKRHPDIRIIASGLSDREAVLVEAAAIELLGRKTLTNAVRGFTSRIGAVGSIEDLRKRLDARPIKFRRGDSLMLININRKYHEIMGESELYEATRSAWKVAPNRHNPKHALAVYRGVVYEVYEIEEWQQARRPGKLGRLEFIGRRAGESVRRRFLGKSVAKHFSNGAQNPIKYINR